ncbi:hypothetical protein [Pleionea mediterranea]|uniref:Uncharacterized protein n=1 Tax=Pleionea mediterranea TaxID=523701 RepID=A0A316FZD7_9GAMM|nr:hypothetical protein [Pleionea mediterranea]PWK53752.1 hypothetical protein C8D97_102141 [Pleionea mediterranea]
MSLPAQYDVLLSGELSQEKAEVVAALSKLFKKSEQQIDALLNKAPVAVKKNVEETVAQQYKQAIEKRGALVILEQQKNALHDSWSLEPTDEEAEKSVTGKASYVAKDIESDFQAAPQRSSASVSDEEHVSAHSEHTSLPDESFESDNDDIVSKKDDLESNSDSISADNDPHHESDEAESSGWKSKIKGLFNKD